MKDFRRELAIGEVSYVYPFVVEKPTAKAPKEPFHEMAFDALVQAMYEKNYGAIARLVTRDGMDPKMGVLAPSFAGEAMCLLWVQVRLVSDPPLIEFFLPLVADTIYAMCWPDAIRRRRPEVHLPVPRQADQQERRDRHGAPVHPHAGAAGRDGRLRGRDGFDGGGEDRGGVGTSCLSRSPARYVALTARLWFSCEGNAYRGSTRAIRSTRPSTGSSKLSCTPGP